MSEDFGFSEWNLEEELLRNTKLETDTFNSFKEFCNSIPTSSVSNVTDNLLVAILHSCDYDIERSRNLATRYFDLRFASPEVFQNRQVDETDVLTGLVVLYFIPLPRKSPEGYRIFLQKIRRSEVHLFDHAATCKLQFLTMDACIHHEPTCPGYIFLGDMRGLSIGHMLKGSLLLARKLIRYMQEGNPLKIQQIVVFNACTLTDKLLALIKPFVNKDVWKIMKFYSTEQMDDFYRTIPRSHMPEELGGDLPDFESLQKSQEQWLRQVQPTLDRLLQT